MCRVEFRLSRGWGESNREDGTLRSTEDKGRMDEANEGANSVTRDLRAT